MQFLRGFLNRLAILAVLVRHGLPGHSACICRRRSSCRATVASMPKPSAPTSPGTDKGDVNQAIKDLYATGLFSDVRVSRGGGTIVVTVVENSVINRVAFEGNSKIKGDAARPGESSRSRAAPTRPPSCRPTSSASRTSIAARAAATPRSPRAPSTCPTAGSTWSSRSTRATRPASRPSTSSATRPIPNGRLRGLMQTTEMNLLSFFKTSDVYDPDRIAGGRGTDPPLLPEERLRRFPHRRLGREVRSGRGRLHHHHHGRGRPAVHGRRRARSNRISPT